MCLSSRTAFLFHTTFTYKEKHMIKNYSFVLDLSLLNSVKLPGIVSGDTGNVFDILLVSNTNPVTDLETSRVRLVTENKDGLHSQDSIVEGSDITIISGEVDGVETQGIEVVVHSGMISNGRNSGYVELYQTSEGSEIEWDVKLTSQEFTFNAVGSPSEVAASYPSLTGLEARLKTLIEQLEGYLATFDPSKYLRLDAQTLTEEQAQQVRDNISAAYSLHTHGNISNDGSIANAANKIVETDDDGNIVAERSIVVTKTDPSSLTGLQDNDIVLYEQV